MPRARRVADPVEPAPPGTLFPKDREVRSLDGTPIRYTVRGRGAPTVVVCAGFACPDNHWRYLVPALERRGRVVVWNYRGMGASGLPSPPGFRAMRLGREDFRLDRYAEDLEAVLDAEGIRRAVLLGHSMGTQVALEGYRRMPGRVAGLVLVAGPYASPFHTMYSSDLGDRLFPLVRCGVQLVPPALLRLWGPLWRSPLPFPWRSWSARSGRGHGRPTWTATSGTWRGSTRWCWSRWPRACTAIRRSTCCRRSACRCWWWRAAAIPGRRRPSPSRWPPPCPTPSCT